MNVTGDEHFMYTICFMTKTLAVVLIYQQQRTETDHSIVFKTKDFQEKHYEKRWNCQFSGSMGQT